MADFEIQFQILQKRPKRKHPTDLTKGIDKLEDDIPLGVAIHKLFGDKARKIYGISNWTNCIVQIK